MKELATRENRLIRSGRTGKVNGKAIILVLLALNMSVSMTWWLPRAESSASASDSPVEPARIFESQVKVLTKLAITKNSDALAAAGADGAVVIWRIPGRRSAAVYDATGSASTMLAWSPDGLLLCGDASGLLRGWQLPKLEGSRIDSPQVPVTCCVFRQKSGEKQMLLGLSDGRIVQVDQSGTTLRDSGHRGVKAMLISSDQNVLISAGSEGKLIWYDFKRDKVLGTASKHDTEIGALGWSSDGKQFVSADWNGKLRIWDAKTRKLTAEASQPDAVSALAWVDDRIVTGSWDGRIRVWSVESNQIELSSVINTGRPIHSLVVDTSGETAFTVSGDGDVREWKLSSDPQQ